MLKKPLKLLVLSAALVAAGPLHAQTSKPIKIGSFVSATGQGAFLGETTKKTLELLVTETNKSGGINGRTIELVLYDSKTSAKDAATLVRRLIEQDKVDILIGGNTTGETMAVVPFIEESRIPFIALAGATIVTDPVKKYVFRTPHTDQMSVEKIYKEIRKNGGAKVALLSGAGGYDQSCRKNAKQMAPTLAVQLVSDEQHGTGDSDVTAQLTNIRSAGADAIVYCGFGAASSIVAKNYKQLGMQPPLYMTVGVASQAYIDGAGGAAEGSRVTGSAILAFKDLAATDPIYGVTKTFIDLYRAAYKEDPSTFSGYAHDAFLLATEAIKAADSTDMEKVRGALEGLRGIPGINGVYNLSPTDHMGFSADAFRVVVVKGGEFRLAE